MNRSKKVHRLPALCLLFAAACSGGGGSTSPYPYTIGKTNVIGAANTTDGSGSVYAMGGAGGSSAATADVSTDRVGVAQVASIETPQGEACVQVGDSCVTPQDSCVGRTADVIVGSDGSTLSTICYPDRDYHVVTLDATAVSNPPLDNNSVVVVDGRDDGVDITSDVHITGNNVILYGYGPETSVLGGNLSIDKNNAIVRGVRIEGDVEISKNDASLVDCRIDGNLTISGNNVNLAQCEIWGKLTITGQNTVFVSNLVRGDQAVEGDNLRCNDNHRFEDPDADGVIQDGEVGAAIVCESRVAPVTATTGQGKK